MKGSWADVNQGLRDNGITGDGGDLLAIWEGKVLARTEGEYTLDMEGDGALSFLVDGKLVGASGGSQVSTVQPGVTLPARVHLTAGEHKLEVRFLTSSYDTKLFIYWQQPNGKRELLLPSALAPG
jgi:hypothetical protein